MPTSHGSNPPLSRSTPSLRTSRLVPLARRSCCTWQSSRERGAEMQGAGATPLPEVCLPPVQTLVAGPGAAFMAAPAAARRSAPCRRQPAPVGLPAGGSTCCTWEQAAPTGSCRAASLGPAPAGTPHSVQSWCQTRCLPTAAQRGGEGRGGGREGEGEGGSGGRSGRRPSHCLCPDSRSVQCVLLGCCSCAANHLHVCQREGLDGRWMGLGGGGGECREQQQRRHGAAALHHGGRAERPEGSSGAEGGCVREP